MCPIATLLHRRPLRIHPLPPHCRHPPLHPSLTSCWPASNAVWQYQWQHAAMLTRSIVHPNAYSSPWPMLDSIPLRPMDHACLQTNTLTRDGLMAMLVQMDVHMSNTILQSVSNRWQILHNVLCICLLIYKFCMKYALYINFALYFNIIN